MASRMFHTLPRHSTRVIAPRTQRLDRDLLVVNKELQVGIRQLCKQLHDKVEEHINKNSAKDLEIAGLKNEAMNLLEMKMRLQHNFNVRGALERIVFRARLDAKIDDHGGVQKNLNALAKLPDFESILNQDIADHKLVDKDVERCVKHLYHEVSKHAHGNTNTITIRAHDYTPGERATLVAFFKLQDTWTSPLTWKVEE